MRFVRVAGFLALVQTASVVSAQSGSPPAVLLEDLKVCQAEMSDAKRLRCYDARLDDALGVDEALSARREQFRRDRFGLPVDDSGLQMTKLEATVRAVDQDLRRNTTVLELDNGQVWQLQSDGGLRATFQPGMAVIISEKAMGGYRIRIPEKAGFRGASRIR